MDRRYVGIDPHRRRSVIYAMDAAGDKLFCERIANDPWRLLDVVGLAGAKQHRKPAKLSGGEQQRVSIACALANRPKLILADEPTGNLDTKTGAMIIELLQAIAHLEHTTVIAVTHDPTIAAKADQVFELEDGKLKTPAPLPV
jgi:putative ABC transport system ATP-binding protein